jgi:hypothetical protein
LAQNACDSLSFLNKRLTQKQSVGPHNTIYIGHSLGSKNDIL